MGLLGKALRFKRDHPVHYRVRTLLLAYWVYWSMAVVLA